MEHKYWQEGVEHPVWAANWPRYLMRADEMETRVPLEGGGGKHEGRDGVRENILLRVLGCTISSEFHYQVVVVVVVVIVM